MRSDEEHVGRPVLVGCLDRGMLYVGMCEGGREKGREMLSLAV